MSAPTNGAPLAIALMLETDGPGGAENVVFQLAEELRRRGHRVVPVGPGWKHGWLRVKYAEAGIDYRTFSRRWAFDPRRVGELARLMRDERVDVVHSHEFTMSVFGAAAARLAGCRHVITMHGNQKMTAAWRRRAALRWAFRTSHHTVACSRATKASLDSDLGLAPDVVEVVLNGVPVRPGRPDGVRRELGLGPEDVLLLAVGNLVPRKGHIHLLEAMARLRGEGIAVPWHVAIAGRGDERERLEAFAAEHGMADRVHLLGVRDDVPDLQAAADVFVMPSLWEGLPLAILEAMHAGNPVVATTCSGIPEALDDGKQGLLVPPGDSAALAGALRRVLVEPEFRQALGEEARRRARAEFTIGAMTDAYERLYRAPSSTSS